MKGIKGLMIVIGLVAFVDLLAQDIGFSKTTHDFGEVKEEDGPVTYSFAFVNKSGDSLRITSVNASCGCTTPDWSKEALTPGDSGFITAQFDPLNRPGKFKKSLGVGYSTGGQSSVETLYIEGLVQPKPKTIEDELPTEMGAIRVKYKAFNMGKITTYEPATQNFEVYNDSDTAISWRPDLSIVPGFIDISYLPDTLDAKSLGVVSLTYDAKAKNDLGFVTDDIVLYTSEPADSTKEFHVIATIEEYFPPMTPEEMTRAPKLVFDKTQHDFGKVNQGTEVVGTFKIKNSGREDLIIRKTKTNCACTVSRPEKNVIAPGEEIELEVTFNTSGRRGRQYKTVTVFSNDPSASSQMISIKADVDD